MSEDTVKAEAENPENDVVGTQEVKDDASAKNADTSDKVIEENDVTDKGAAIDPLDEEKKPAKFPTLLIVLLVVLGLIGLSIFSSRYSIDKKAVGTQISDIEGALSKQFTAAGSNLSFDYGAMDIKGGLFSKHIVIDKPRFSLKNRDGSHTIITSNALIAEPTSRDGTEILFHAGDEVTLEKNGERYALTSSERLKLKVTNDDTGLGYALSLPQEINLRNLTTNVRYAAITAAQGMLNGTVGEASSIAFNAKDATLFLKQRQLIASSVSFKNDYSYKAGTMLSDITIDSKAASFSAPYNLFGALDIAAKASFETASFSEEYGIPSEQNIEVESFTASNGEINTLLNGTFQFIENELIPLGNASLKIDGVDALFTTLSRSNMLDARGEKVLRNVLDKAAKEWKPEEDGVLVEFQREYGGGFYIGDVTFEELVALALRSYFGTAPKAVAEEAPSQAPEPVATKAVVPEATAVDAQQVEAEVKEELQKNGVVIGDVTSEDEVAPEVEAEKETAEKVEVPEAEIKEKAEETVKEPEVEAVKVADEKPAIDAVEETLDSVVPALDVSDDTAKPVEDAAVPNEKTVEAIVEADEAITEETTSATEAVKSGTQTATEAAKTVEDAAKDAVESSLVIEAAEEALPTTDEVSAEPVKDLENNVDEVVDKVNEAIDQAEQANSAANNILNELPAQ